MNLVGFAVLFSIVLSYSLVNDSWGDNGVYPLSSYKPDTPFHELAPLEALAQEAKLMGVGEVSHGTTNDTSRYWIVKFLVEKMGYRIIFAEHTMATTLQHDYQTYISTCAGNADEFMSSQSSGVFKTREYFEFFQWLCQYNLEHPSDAVSFVGIDMLNDSNLMISVLGQVDSILGRSSDYLRNFGILKQDCFGARYGSRNEFFNSPEFKEWNRTGRLDSGPHRSCLSAANEMERILRESEMEIRAVLGDLSFVTIVSMPRSLAGRNIDAAEYATDITGSQTIRDQIQADNLWDLWSALGRNRKAILFEHNYHVARHQSELSHRSWPNVVSVGERMLAKLGTEYRAVGWTAFKYRAFYSKKENLSDGPDSIDLEMNRLGGDFYLIDTRGTLAESKTWSMQATPEVLQLSRQFDFLFYTREAGPATPYVSSGP